MAEGISTNQDLFTCPICLDILKDPVTLHCGHNYCMDCIKGCWDQEDQKGVYSCPQCRQTFTPRPVLNKNNVFAELVELFRKTKIQAVAASIAELWARPEEVNCNLCTDRKLKAVKSCLDCLLSYCETHFKVHSDVNPGRRHKVVDATDQLGLQERICTKHEKPLEVFCRTDQKCVCLFCLVDEHKGHDTVSASVGKIEKQAEAQRGFQQRIQEREKKHQELRKAVETLKNSAQTAVEDSERIFTEMIRSIGRKRSEVKELIRAQEKAEVSRAEGLLKQLEQEIAELKRRNADLQQLSHSEDHIYFLKSLQLVSDLPEPKDFCINQNFSLESVKKFVSTLKDQLEDYYKYEVMRISSAGTALRITLPIEPTTREEFLQYSCYFTLDPNTAYRNLHLSEGNRRVDSKDEVHSNPDNLERFNGFPQVLCREGVCGRCYWEVEWHEEVAIAVSYNSISRKGNGHRCRFGFNNQSWSLRLLGSDFCFKHNNKDTNLPLVASSRIGVYVDHRAGTLAFYSISDTMTLLHRVQTTFTDTLYPGFDLVTGSSVKFL